MLLEACRYSPSTQLSPTQHPLGRSQMSERTGEAWTHSKPRGQHVEGPALGWRGGQGIKFKGWGWRGSIPTERERSQCKLIKAGGRAWGRFQASQSADACSCVWNINMSLVQPLSTPRHHRLPRLLAPHSASPLLFPTCRFLSFYFYFFQL